MGNAVCSGSVPIYSEAPTRTGAVDKTYSNYGGAGPWHTCMKDGNMPPRVASTGQASVAATPATTLPKLLEKAATSKAAEVALMVERGADGLCPPVGADGKAPPALPREEWTSWTYADMNRDIQNAAKGFMALGFQRFDSVNIWGFNSPEWVMSALAASVAGGKSAGIYPTDAPDTVAYKVVHSGGSIVVVEEKKKIAGLLKGLAARGDAKRIKAFVCWADKPAKGETVVVPGCGTVPVFSWQDLLEMGKSKVSDAELSKRSNEVQPGHCAALIYTSGTTGEPKAVMISHDNIIYEATTVTAMVSKSVGFADSSNERLVSYLPLSHVAGMMVDIVTPVVVSATQPAAVTIHFARPYDLKIGTVKDRLNFAKPTIFLGVPLVWEKIADRIRAIGAETTGVKKSIATWAKGLGLEHAMECQLGKSGARSMAYGLADKVILKKIKANLGLDECKFAFTGAAPIRVDTLEYFGSLGLSINEVYGMSECTGACSWSTNQAHQWGSCGWEMPGVEIRAFIVDPVDLNKKTPVPLAPGLDCVDEKFMGELCFRGRNNMMGYMANPDLGQAHVDEIKKKTAETIDKDGWLHSGDKGLITAAGMVKITGRYKELIIGEGGENIAPVPIEDHVKKMCDGINEVMMIGDKRKYNVALVTLKAKGANGESPGSDELDAGAARVNPAVQTITAAMDDATWIAAVTAAVTSANANDKVCHNNSFKIQKFCILPTNFSEETNDLTPTKKLKRKNVETRFAPIVEKMYKTQGSGYVKFSQ